LGRSTRSDTKKKDSVETNQDNSMNERETRHRTNLTPKT
jgi:hypothetical protein